MLQRVCSGIGILAMATGLVATMRPAVDPIAPNDNRAPAGTLQGNVLTVALEARTGVWKPEGEDGPGVTVSAFAEEGKSLTVPGPMIRVPAGTEVRATIRNRLTRPLVVVGFDKERRLADSVVIPVGESRPASFVLGKAGTFFYLGYTGPSIRERRETDQPLGGAIIVDSVGAPPVPNDRVLVLSWYSTIDSASATGLGQSTMAINGRSWPNTERLDYVQGDSIHWRVLNLTEIDHPMHLHGFYFRVTSRGRGTADSTYAPGDQLSAVTELLDPFRTITMSWKAERAGNWIYHCHYALHLSSLSSLEMVGGIRQQGHASHRDGEMKHQMFGLVMGIRVAPREAVAPVPLSPRRIRVTMRERDSVYGVHAGYSFVVSGSSAERDARAMPVPGEPLILERGKPVAITIVNRARDHAAIHWHGIELESFPDGVPGWSGSGPTVLKPIAPGDSLTVRFTPPRAGSFMYHSHINEAAQMGGGAYGPIIVVEPGQKFDPETDRIMFFGTAGFAKNVVFGPHPDILLNGQRRPEVLSLAAGKRYRFRFFNLAGDFPVAMKLSRGDTLATWTLVAKDGFALPASQVRSSAARLQFTPGEIYDFEFTAAAAGDMSFTFGPPPASPGAPPLPPNFAPLPPTVTVPVRIR